METKFHIITSYKKYRTNNIITLGSNKFKVIKKWNEKKKNISTYLVEKQIK